MLTTEDQSKELTIPKNSNIPIILIDSISETANKSTSLNSEISRFNSQSMIDIESNNPVFVHNFTSNQKIDRNRQRTNNELTASKQQATSNRRQPPGKPQAHYRQTASSQQTTGNKHVVKTSCRKENVVNKKRSRKQKQT